VLGSVLLVVASALSLAISLATTILIVRVVLSWFRPNPSAGFLRSLVEAVYAVTDPPLAWMRARFPFLVLDRIDLTPLVAFLGLSLLRSVLVGGLTSWALTLGA